MRAVYGAKAIVRKKEHNIELIGIEYTLVCRKVIAEPKVTVWIGVRIA